LPHDVVKFAVGLEKYGALGCGSVCERDRNVNVQEIIQSNYNVQIKFPTTISLQIKENTTIALVYSLHPQLS